MAAVKENETVNRQTEEARDFMELLKKLTGDEKQQVKGIMIGIVMMRDHQMTERTA